MRCSWLSPSENSELADRRGCALVGAPRALGVGFQQYGRIMPAPRRHHVHRHAGVKQGGFVRPAQVVEAQPFEAELGRALYKKIRGRK